MSKERKQLGASGEDLATEFLEKLGYKIVRYNNQWVYKDIQSIWWGIVEECKKRAEELKRK